MKLRCAACGEVYYDDEDDVCPYCGNENVSEVITDG